MRKPFVYLCLGLALGFGGNAPAQDAYSGVTTSNDQVPPRARSARRAKVLTWPGLEMLHGGGSRFFFQTSKAVEWSTHHNNLRFELTLKRTSVHLRNTLRPLETRHFATPVRRAWVRRSGRDTKAIFELKRTSKPVVRQETREDGFHFVFVEFAKLASAEN